METDTELEFLNNNLDTFLNFMKEKYPFYHNSNVFLKDMQYGIKHFFEKRNLKLGYAKTEAITDKLLTMLESRGTLRKLNKNTWILNFS
ncbi:MAG: hypothetical protein WCJ01_06365 [Ignavibacteria bacterium]